MKNLVEMFLFVNAVVILITATIFSGLQLAEFNRIPLFCLIAIPACIVTLIILHIRDKREEKNNLKS